VGDHQRQSDDPVLIPDLVVAGVDPDEGIFLLQKLTAKVFDLILKPLVDLRNLGGRDVFDPNTLANRSTLRVEIPLKKATSTSAAKANSEHPLSITKSGVYPPYWNLRIRR